MVFPKGIFSKNFSNFIIFTIGTWFSCDFRLILTHFFTNSGGIEYFILPLSIVVIFSFYFGHIGSIGLLFLVKLQHTSVLLKFVALLEYPQGYLIQKQVQM